MTTTGNLSPTANLNHLRRLPIESWYVNNQMLYITTTDTTPSERANVSHDALIYRGAQELVDVDIARTGTDTPAAETILRLINQLKDRIVNMMRSHGGRYMLLRNRTAISDGDMDAAHPNRASTLLSLPSDDVFQPTAPTWDGGVNPADVNIHNCTYGRTYEVVGADIPNQVSPEDAWNEIVGFQNNQTDHELTEYLKHTINTIYPAYDTDDIVAATDNLRKHILRSSMARQDTLLDLTLPHTFDQHPSYMLDTLKATAHVNKLLKNMIKCILKNVDLPSSDINTDNLEHTCVRVNPTEATVLPENLHRFTKLVNKIPTNRKDTSYVGEGVIQLCAEGAFSECKQGYIDIMTRLNPYESMGYVNNRMYTMILDAIENTVINEGIIVSMQTQTTHTSEENRRDPPPLIELPTTDENNLDWCTGMNVSDDMDTISLAKKYLKKILISDDAMIKAPEDDSDDDVTIYDNEPYKTSIQMVKYKLPDNTDSYPKTDYELLYILPNTFRKHPQMLLYDPVFRTKLHDDVHAENDNDFTPEWIPYDIFKSMMGALQISIDNIANAYRAMLEHHNPIIKMSETLYNTIPAQLRRGVRTTMDVEEPENNYIYIMYATDLLSKRWYRALTRYTGPLRVYTYTNGISTHMKDAATITDSNNWEVTVIADSGIRIVPEDLTYFTDGTNGISYLHIENQLSIKAKDVALSIDMHPITTPQRISYTYNFELADLENVMNNAITDIMNHYTADHDSNLRCLRRTTMAVIRKTEDKYRIYEHYNTRNCFYKHNNANGTQHAITDLNFFTEFIVKLLPDVQTASRTWLVRPATVRVKGPIHNDLITTCECKDIMIGTKRYEETESTIRSKLIEEHRKVLVRSSRRDTIAYELDMKKKRRHDTTNQPTSTIDTIYNIWTNYERHRSLLLRIVILIQSEYDIVDKSTNWRDKTATSTISTSCITLIRELLTT